MIIFSHESDKHTSTVSSHQHKLSNGFRRQVLCQTETKRALLLNLRFGSIQLLITKPAFLILKTQTHKNLQS